MNDKPPLSRSRPNRSILAKAALAGVAALALSITLCFAGIGQSRGGYPGTLSVAGMIGIVVSIVALMVVGLVGVLRLVFRRRQP